MFVQEGLVVMEAPAEIVAQWDSAEAEAWLWRAVRGGVCLGSGLGRRFLVARLRQATMAERPVTATSHCGGTSGIEV